MPIANKFKKILEMIGTSAEQKALRANPEKYAEYLNALDEVHGPRLERAKQMGFDTENKMYHGTSLRNTGALDNDVIKEFNTGEKGSFFSKDPKLAEHYSGSDTFGSNIYPVYLNTNKIFDVSTPKHLEQILNQPNITKDTKDIFQHIYENPNKTRYTGKNSWSALEHSNIQEPIKSTGFEGYNINENGIKNTAIYNPKNIRSTQAAFDPRFVESTDILSGKIGTTEPSALKGAAFLSKLEDKGEPMPDYASLFKNKTDQDKLQSYTKGLDTNDPGFKMDTNQTEDLLTGGKFPDTGRQGSYGEKLDSMLGVPARTAIAEAQEGRFNTDAMKKVLHSFGSDPQKAPTSESIVDRTGIENPYLAAGLATAVDVGGQLPMPGGMMPGAAGAIKRVNPEAIQPMFPKLEKMFTINNQTFPAKNAAHAMQIAEQLKKVPK